ncbi:MAG TPA: methyltransferase domain-containing protein [Actinomycetota bacterium]|nr:methyltransferase domain-containing protein [Actinomycetota bacterium]
MTDPRTHVKERYAAAAGTARDPMIGRHGRCGESYYDGAELDGLPAAVAGASLGCANPLVVADLRAGEIVLDLGSGAGLDVLLSARRVGPTGQAYGIDMTPEMLEQARANQRAAGVTNAQFLKGFIEDVPLPTGSVDVVLSNCVINLSPSKSVVFSEMFRVLRPGGRIAVADVVAEHPLDAETKARLETESPCLAGAATRADYEEGLTGAGFVDVALETQREVAPGFSSVIARGSSRASLRRHRGPEGPSGDSPGRTRPPA